MSFADVISFNISRIDLQQEPVEDVGRNISQSFARLPVSIIQPAGSDQRAPLTELR